MTKITFLLSLLLYSPFPLALRLIAVENGQSRCQLLDFKLKEVANPGDTAYVPCACQGNKQTFVFLLCCHLVSSRMALVNWIQTSESSLAGNYSSEVVKYKWIFSKFLIATCITISLWKTVFDEKQIFSKNACISFHHFATEVIYYLLQIGPSELKYPIRLDSSRALRSG